VLGYERSGNCDIYNNPGALDEVELAVLRACEAAGVNVSDIDTAAYSLCGCDWPEDFTLWEEQLTARGLGKTFRVVNDAVGALSSDVPNGNAIVISVGTGAGIGSRNEQGEVWHSSFWQLYQGGHEMSYRALRAIYSAELGIDPPTAMTAPVLAYFGLPSVERLLHAFTGRGEAPPRYVQGLVPILFTAADGGDDAAGKILAEYGAAYADIATAAARKVSIVGKPINLLLTGGVFRNPSQLLRQHIIDRLHASMPQITVVSSRSEPIKGALTIALQMLGTVVDAAVEQRVTETMPPVDFFHTHIRPD
jgi:N-acetylglucosamine kinase-like BadF-type ATPase